MMALVCQGPSCDHEFDDAVSHGVTEAASVGEVPFVEFHSVPDDGIGVQTDFFCSTGCAVEFFTGGKRPSDLADRLDGVITGAEPALTDDEIATVGEAIDLIRTYGGAKTDE